MSRANPFADLSDFEPQATPKAVSVEAIDTLAAESGFPSRKPRAAKAAAPAINIPPPVELAEAARPIRRYTTGRNRQINIKATSETIERFYRLADEHGVPLGALLDEALDALETKQSG